MGNNTLEDIREANGSLTSLSLKAIPEGSSSLGANFSIVDANKRVIAPLSTLGLGETVKYFDPSLIPNLNINAFDVSDARSHFDTSRYIAAHLYYRHSYRSGVDSRSLRSVSSRLRKYPVVLPHHPSDTGAQMAI
jgi:hypothetical protein